MNGRTVGFGAVLWSEFAKLRRAKVTWFTLVAFALGPLGIALFMWIVREPGRAAQLGLLGAKADLSGLTATWPSYASVLTLIVGLMGGMVLLPFVIAYVFGREYADGTAKNLLALPVPRSRFVAAKLVVVATWWLVLVAAILAEAFAVGGALALPGFSPAVAGDLVRHALLAAGISYLLVPAVAWITVLGRGYLPSLGFAVGMLALGNLFVHTGWSVWFPWSIVPLLIGAVGAPAGSLPAGSYVVVAATFAAGVAATVLQLRYADNAQ